MLSSCLITILKFAILFKLEVKVMHESWNLGFNIPLESAGVLVSPSLCYKLFGLCLYTEAEMLKPDNVMYELSM